MKQWRRALLAVLVAGSMALGGPALAGHERGDSGGRPTNDPTCGHGNSQRDDAPECPGDNGSQTAEEAVCSAPGEGAGLDLASDILEERDEDACE